MWPCRRWRSSAYRDRRRAGQALGLPAIGAIQGDWAALRRPRPDLAASHEVADGEGRPALHLPRRRRHARLVIPVALRAFPPPEIGAPCSPCGEADGRPFVAGPGGADAGAESGALACCSNSADRDPRCAPALGRPPAWAPGAWRWRSWNSVFDQRFGLPTLCPARTAAAGPGVDAGRARRACVAFDPATPLASWVGGSISRSSVPTSAAGVPGSIIRGRCRVGGVRAWLEPHRRPGVGPGSGSGSGVRSGRQAGFELACALEWSRRGGRPGQ